MESGIVAVLSREKKPWRKAANPETPRICEKHGINKLWESARIAKADICNWVKSLFRSREKQKGNESFKSKDYEEAIRYYSRSLILNPNNAVVYIKSIN